MKITITGDKDIIIALEGIRRRTLDPEEAAAPLAESMRRYAHVMTGYLRDSIYHEGNFAVASAPYAEYEADRGGDHDFAGQAVDDFNMERFADRIVEPF
jgi:hypothetical protein